MTLKKTIIIDNINIKRVFCKKKLGVTIDHKFSWKTQIADVCKKVSRCTGILNKVKSILSTKILNSLYSSLVEPHFTYCVEVWGNTYRTYLQSSYKKQKGQSVLYVKVATCVIQKSCLRN